MTLVLPSHFVCFDFEWPDGTIKAFSVVSSDGIEKAYLIEDYAKFGDKAETALLLEFIRIIRRYQYSFGFNSKGVEKLDKKSKSIIGHDSDLATLDKRLQANKIPSIIWYSSVGNPFIDEYHQHIDLYKLFYNSVAKTNIDNKGSWNLDNTAKIIIGRGKYKGYSGKDFDKIESLEEKRAYSLEDSKLVYDMLVHENSKILKMMFGISKLTGVNFQTVCNSGVSTVWSKILDKELGVPYQELEFEGDDSNKVKFKGAITMDPVPGIYSYVDVYDLKSIYPGVVISRNLSFDTLCCSCCREDKLAQVPKEITQDDKLAYVDFEKKIQKDYWICRKQTGVFPKKMKEFRDERLRQKKMGNEYEAQGMKILVNGGYGANGFRHYKYYNLDVALLVTAFARNTFKKMKLLAEENYNVIYGDTDSVFLSKPDNSKASDVKIKSFIDNCEKLLGVEVEHDVRYVRLLMHSAKNYIGILEDPTAPPVIVGMSGGKSDRCEFVTNVFAEVVNVGFYQEQDPMPIVKEAFEQLSSKNVANAKQVLLMSQRVGKNIYEYKGNGNRTKKIASRLGLEKGDAANFYSANKNHKETYLLESEFDISKIDFVKYKKYLTTSIEKIVKALGYNLNDVTREQEQQTTLASDEIVSKDKVIGGVEYLLQLFEKVGQQIFPRKIATALSEGKQFTVNSKEEMIRQFEESNFIDCRINAYPVDLSLNTSLVLFIDLDLKDKKTATKILKRDLKDTLQNIEDNNLTPNLVLWTGNGNHIYLGLKIKSLVELLSAEACGISSDESELAKNFMKFAKIFLSNKKADACNTPSLESCLLRVPYSLNSKCIKKGTEPEVKIIHSNLEVNEGMPQLMLSEFYAYLVSKKLNEEARIEERSKFKAKGISRLMFTPWIEKLLKTPISDYRKYCIWKIFVPYLTNKRGLSYNEIYSLIEEWCKKCSNLRVLDFDIDAYTQNVYDRVEEYYPISLDNLEGEKGNKELYRIVINVLKNKQGHMAKPSSGMTDNCYSNGVAS